MNTTILTVLLVGGAAAVLAFIAAGLLTAEASRRDLARRVQHAVRSDAVGTVKPRPTLGGLLVRTLQQFGQGIRDSALVSGAAAADLERAATGAGLNPRNAVPIALAVKVLLLVLCPILVFAATALMGVEGISRILSVVFAIAVGMLLPNWALGWARGSHQAALQRGLPDALDLLVVCTEAGLGLESAVDRVAFEMRGSDPSIASEFFALGQELRLTSDRASALSRFADRTQLETWQRLARTLAQTLRYGTPLGKALRSLAVEMRNDRLLRLEEKAAKLPALMTIPMILFFLPCLFIIVAGPAAIRILNAMQ
ncbi:MAG: pilus assembly protein TadC [Rhodospirillales bacterium]|jgi:tight adherence protein C|nr:pilus assembly protein TadC [Rhodospirillales bacterium]MDB5383748.1 pilus assembly protein TadC [Rhodospirillales bacterium]